MHIENREVLIFIERKLHDFCRVLLISMTLKVNKIIINYKNNISWFYVNIGTVVWYILKGDVKKNQTS